MSGVGGHVGEGFRNPTHDAGGNSGGGESSPPQSHPRAVAGSTVRW